MGLEHWSIMSLRSIQLEHWLWLLQNVKGKQLKETLSKDGYVYPNKQSFYNEVRRCSSHV